MERPWSWNSPEVITLRLPRAPGPLSQLLVPTACWLVHQWQQTAWLDRLTWCPGLAFRTALLLWLWSYPTQADTPWVACPGRLLSWGVWWQTLLGRVCLLVSLRWQAGLAPVGVLSFSEQSHFFKLNTYYSQSLSSYALSY